MRCFVSILVLPLLVLLLDDSIARAQLPDNNPGWQSVFDDEFNSANLNTSNWGYGLKWATHNTSAAADNNDAAYMDSSHVTIATDAQSDSFLQIAATPGIPAGYPTVNSNGGYDMSYTSGGIWSKVNFNQNQTYVEARMKMPGNEGTWPAFYLLPANESWPPEIDVLENPVNPNISSVAANIDFYTFHGVDSAYPSSNHQVGGTYTDSTSLASGWNTYGASWNLANHSVTFYFNGVALDTIVPLTNSGSYMISSDAGFQNMYLLFTDSIGGWANANGTGPGVPTVATDGFTQANFDADWVRVFTAVPEPACLGWMIGLLYLGGRKRKPLSTACPSSPAIPPVNVQFCEA